MANHYMINSQFKSNYMEDVKSIRRDVQWRLLTAGMVVTDLLAIALAFRLAYFVRFTMGLSIFRLDAFSSILFYQRLVLILVPLWLIIFAVMGLYDRQKMLAGMQEYSLIFNGTTIGMLLIIGVSFLYPNFILARGWLILAWGFVFLLTMINRFAMRNFVYYLRGKGYFLSNAVIVGANNEGLSLAEQFMNKKSSGLDVKGFIDKKIPVGKKVLNDLKVLGDLEQIDDVIADYEVEELILASSAISSRDKLMEIFQKYGVDDEINVRLSSGLYEIITTGLTVKEIAYVPLVVVNPVRLTGMDVVLKAILDYCIALPALLVLSPIMLVIAILIKLDSPGPIIHRRRVMGVNGEEFDALKFRTMYVNGNEILKQYPDLMKELTLNHKLKDDPRITKIGKILRRTSLDELPQLFNVIRREMSMVGPRIITKEEMEKYDKWDINLLTVRPGISGLWQVSGRSNLSYSDRVNLDMYYVRNWSIWLDLQILVQTIPVVLKGEGAY